MSEKLDAAILTLIQRGARSIWTDDHERLALELFRYQYELIPFYQKYSRRFGITPESIKNSKEIPPLPTYYFKKHRLASFPDSKRIATFWTSGTTTAERGEHIFDTLSLYDFASEISFCDLSKSKIEYRWISLIPSRMEAPHSSLAYMVDHLSKGRAKYDEIFHDHRPVFMAATTVALSDYLDSLDKPISLPDGSRIFETGGRKGRRFVPTSAELSKRAEELLHITPENYLGEYGMTEMSSPSWGKLEDGHWVYQSPAWAPVTIVNSQTLQEVSIGEEGLVKVLDLANRGSVSALLTGDWGKRHKNGFEILGRVIESEMRGCSLMAAPPPPPIESPPKIHLSVIKERVASATIPSPEQTARALESLSVHFLPVAVNDAVSAGLHRTFAELAQLNCPLERPSQPGLHIYIHAGNLPVTGVFGFYESLLSGTPSIHRPSSNGGDLLKQLHPKLEAIDPVVAARMAIVETPSYNDIDTKELFRGATKIVAQGDDETLAHLMTLAPANAEFVAQGPKLSAALIDLRLRPTPNEIDGLVQDVFIWEQQGCLSPQILFLIGDQIDPFIESLLWIADRRGTNWNRSPSRRFLGRIRWQELTSDETFFAGEQLTIATVKTPNAEWFATPGFIQLIQISSPDEISRFLAPFESQLGSLATNAKIPALGFESIVDLGKLQSPKFMA